EKDRCWVWRRGSPGQSSARWVDELRDADGRTYSVSVAQGRNSARVESCSFASAFFLSLRILYPAHFLRPQNLRKLWTMTLCRSSLDQVASWYRVRSR